MRYVVALVMMMLSAFSMAADGGWVLDSNRGGIKVFSRYVEGHQMKDFRGVVRIKAPMIDVVSAVADVENMPNWFFHLKSTEILTQDRLDNIHIYLVIAGLFPVQDRDAVIKAEMWQDPITREMLMEGYAVPKVAEKDGIVRMPDMRAGWRIRPISDNVTEIELTGAADPGGVIPLWQANMVVTLVPRESLSKLRTLLEDKKYRESLAQKRVTDLRWNKMFSGFKFTRH